MILIQVGISGFRNIQDAQFEPGPGFNLLKGSNGAGKTSVLEALQLLSAGHSFRTRKVKELVTLNHENLSVFAKLLDQDTETRHRAGILKKRSGETELKLDYQPLHSMSDMTRLLPVKSLFPDSHKLIQEGPSERRQFLDWGLFHVEPRFFNEWKIYRRTLEQRNSALRRMLSDPEISAWDAELIASGEKISYFRKTYVEELESWLVEYQRKFGIPGELSARYRPGWKSDLSLGEALELNFDQCRRFKTTTVGPHRAELAVEHNGIAARQIMSRGQQKLLVYALHFAQLGLYCERCSKRPIVLCDDLPAELDQINLNRVLTTLANMQLQTFITSSEDIKFPENSKSKVFHVEHGKMQEVI